MTPESGGEEYLAFADTVAQASGGAVSPLGAGILVAIHLDVANDSRTFARLFGIAHALVLREITGLIEMEFISIRTRDARTQRTFMLLAPAGLILLQRAGSPPEGTPLDAANSPAS